MFTRIAAALALACCMVPPATAQVIDSRPADSLSVDSIVNVIMREGASPRSDAGSGMAQLIAKGLIASWRADSIVQGLRDLALNGANPDVRSIAAAAIAASGDRRGQPALLIEVFDSVRDVRTRTTIMSLARTFTDTAHRRDLILRGVQLSGDRGSGFVASMAALTALQLGDEGSNLLKHALDHALIKDERTLKLVQAELSKRAGARARE